MEIKCLDDSDFVDFLVVISYTEPSGGTS